MRRAFVLFLALLCVPAAAQDRALLEGLEHDPVAHVERARAATVLVWSVPGDYELLGDEWEMPLGSGVVVSADIRL